MCNSHDSIAELAATGPEGILNPGQYAVILVALEKYQPEQYMPEAEGADDYNPYSLASKKRQRAFERSGLKRSLSDIKSDESLLIERLKDKIAILAQSQDLSVKALKLPITTARKAFLDMAFWKLYEGDWRDRLEIVKQTPHADLAPLRRAVSFLHADDETRDILERLMKGSIAKLYLEAPQKANQALLDAYESLPERVKEVSGRLSKYGGNIVLGGFSGLLGHGLHYASVLGTGLAAGAASSTANLGLSVLFLGASYGGWRELFGGKYRFTKEQISALAVQAGLTLAVAWGAQNLMEHNHMSSERAVWYASLPSELRDSFRQESLQIYSSLPEELRLQLDDKARSEGVPPEVYLLLCDGSDSVGQEINAYLRARAENPPQTNLQAGRPSP